MGFDFRLHGGPKNESLATAQPGTGFVQPVSGSVQPTGKLSVSSSMIFTVAVALVPPGAPIDTPPVGVSSVTVNVSGPSSAPSCRIGTVTLLVPVSLLAQVSTPLIAVKSALAIAVPLTV